MAQLRIGLLSIIVLVLVSCSNSPIQQSPEPSTQINQPPTATPAPTEIAVAIAVDPVSEKLPVDELAESGQLDAIASVQPAAELETAETAVVTDGTTADADTQAVVGQVEIDSPGRAEPPKPEDAVETVADNQPAEVSIDPNVRVNFFRLADRVAKPSEPTMIEWSVEGVESVQITRYGGQYGEAGEQWTVPSAGSMQHTFPETTAGFEVTYLLTSAENQSVANQFNVTVPCEHSWVFDFRDPALLCPGRPLLSNAAMQVFEGGIMIWLEETSTILYSNWDGSISAEVPDTYEHGTDPITDPTYAAPAGYYQPDYGLGKVWRDYAEARIALGWGITPNQGYQAIRQGEPVVPFGDIDEFISLPGDGFLHKQIGGTWEIQYDVPEIQLADVRPAVSAESIPTPEPEPAADSGVVVNYFRFNPPPTRPSDSVTLEWSVSGVNSINIERAGGKRGEANETYTNLPAEGSLTQTFPANVGGEPVVYTLGSNDAEGMALDFAINIPCEHNWVITDHYGEGCPTEPVISNGAQQTFENGFMLWIQDENVIIYSTWDGAQHGVVEDSYEHGVDIVSDQNLVAPSGLYQPEYGFGKVWRIVPGVRDLLGWGIAPTVDFEVRHQTSSTDTARFVEFITLANGGRIIIEHPDTNWKIERR